MARAAALLVALALAGCPSASETARDSEHTPEAAVYSVSVAEARTERVVDGIAIVRVEQLYPFPEEEIQAAIERYPADAEVLWVQEESRNSGAWSYMEPLLREIIGPQRTVEYVGRGAAASPATGSYSIHRQERDEILNKALRQPAPSAEKQANVS